jgi:uncharacterized protein (DUF4415 family)
MAANLGAAMTRKTAAVLHETLMAGLAAEGAPGPAWLGADPGPDRRREKVTLRLRRGTLKHFRRFGPGYQDRIDRVLAAWVAGCEAGLAATPETAPVRAAEEARLAARAAELDRIRAEVRAEAARGAQAEEAWREFVEGE